jgi:hypothetical protein
MCLGSPMDGFRYLWQPNNNGGEMSASLLRLVMCCVCFLFTHSNGPIHIKLLILFLLQVGMTSDSEGNIVRMGRNIGSPVGFKSDSQRVRVNPLTVRNPNSGP